MCLVSMVLFETLLSCYFSCMQSDGRAHWENTVGASWGLMGMGNGGNGERYRQGMSLYMSSVIT